MIWFQLVLIRRTILAPFAGCFQYGLPAIRTVIEDPSHGTKHDSESYRGVMPGLVRIACD